MQIDTSQWISHFKTKDIHVLSEVWPYIFFLQVNIMEALTTVRVAPLAHENFVALLR